MAAKKQKKVATKKPSPRLSFDQWFAKYGKNWDPPRNGLSGGYRIRRAYELGLVPDSAGHLPDSYKGEPLKTYLDPNKITRGIDNGTGYQVAPPTYTGPMTTSIEKSAPRYYGAKTATRPGGPGGWDDVPRGKNAAPLMPPKGYKIPADPAAKYYTVAPKKSGSKKTKSKTKS